MHINTITSFTGEHRFLSNFYPVPVKYDERTYPSVEHAYQTAKVDPFQLNYTEICRTIRNLPTPGRAKRYGRLVPLRPDWNNEKLNIMKMLIVRKFEHSNLATQLINTAPAILIEVNNWGDSYWGVCNGNGANHLGSILMVIRAELKV